MNKDDFILNPGDIFLRNENPFDLPNNILEYSSKERKYSKDSIPLYVIKFKYIADGTEDFIISPERKWKVNKEVIEFVDQHVTKCNKELIIMEKNYNHLEDRKEELERIRETIYKKIVNRE